MKSFIYHVCYGALLTAFSALQINSPVLAQTTGSTEAAPAAEADGNDLINKLQAGGYVIYLRHAQTDKATEDKDLSDMSDCSNQRLLSEEGRETAKNLGEAFRALKIPVASVTTSRFCRAKETAKLMGFDAAAETGDLDNDSGEPNVSKEETERRAVALRKLLASAPPAGENTLIVGHVPNIRNAVALEYAKMKEGELAVFAPKSGEPGYEPIGRILPVNLQELAQNTAK